MKEEKICPRCLENYNGYPAMSRRDNKTDICSKCGTSEAMCDFISLEKISKKDLLVERVFHKKIDVDFEIWRNWKKQNELNMN